MKIEITRDYVRMEVPNPESISRPNHRCFARTDWPDLDKAAEQVERQMGFLLVRERPNGCKNTNLISEAER